MNRTLTLTYGPITNMAAQLRTQWQGVPPAIDYSWKLSMSFTHRSFERTRFARIIDIQQAMHAAGILAARSREVSIEIGPATLGPDKITLTIWDAAPRCLKCGCEFTRQHPKQRECNVCGVLGGVRAMVAEVGR